LVFFGFSFRILHELAKSDPVLADAYSNGKAAYLESAIARAFRKAFPECESDKNYRWREGAIVYENDLLIRVGSHLMIVEAKSGSVSVPALRGAPKSVKQQVLDLLVSPSLQSARLRDRIHKVMANPSLRESLLPGLNIDLAKVRIVLRMSVTLEDFATVQSQLHLLEDTGWLPAEHQMAPCIQLPDLDIVFDLLEPKYQRLHYLTKRCQFEGERNYLGDELNLLGLYLRTGFNPRHDDGGKLVLMGMSSEIDGYYAAASEGIHRPKPRLAISGWWKDICDTLERKSLARWSEGTYVLLSMTQEEQQNLEWLFRKIIKSVRKNWRREHHKCTAMFIPPKGRCDAVCLYAFRDAAMADRMARMENIAGQVFNRLHISRCVVIGLNIDQEHYPYSTFQLFTRTSGEDEVKA
jgi:hypothetical protein